jgi:hypothetical protein
MIADFKREVLALFGLHNDHVVGARGFSSRPVRRCRLKRVLGSMHSDVVGLYEFLLVCVALWNYNVLLY